MEHSTYTLCCHMNIHSIEYKVVKYFVDTHIYLNNNEKRLNGEVNNSNFLGRNELIHFTQNIAFKL